MKSKFYFSLILFLFFSFCPFSEVLAQLIPKSSKAVKFAESATVIDLAGKSGKYIYHGKGQRVGPNGEVNSTNAKIIKPVDPNAIGTPDAALYSQQILNRPVTANPPNPPSVSFDGISFSETVGIGQGFLPPDVNGEVGLNHFVQTVNSAFRIWDKSGNPLTAPLTLTTLFAPLGAVGTADDGDPIVLYDQLADRWIISQFVVSIANPNNHQIIAVSKSGDPTGAYFLYDFMMPNTKFNDYPHFGMWPDGYYMTDNQFNAAGTAFQGAGYFAFDRVKMLKGDPTAGYIYFDSCPTNSGCGISGVLPADVDGYIPPPAGAPCPFVFFEANEFGDPADQLRFFDFHADFAVPANSTFIERTGSPLAVAAFDPRVPSSSNGRAHVDQPSPATTASRLQALHDRLMFRLSYRNFGGTESLIANHTVDADATATYRAAVRFYQLNRTSPTGAFTIAEQQTFAGASGDLENRWMGSGAINHQGDIALGYSVSSLTVFPSIRYAAKLGTDPPGSGLAQGEQTITTGTGSQTSTSSRWGDYSDMTIDPSDDATFWFTQMYQTTSSSAAWRTRIVKMAAGPVTVSPRGNIAGTITNCVTGLPIPNAFVQITGGISRSVTAAGAYSAIVVPGTYTVTVSAPGGYGTVTVPGVVVTNGGTTTVNACLIGVPIPVSSTATLISESCVPANTVIDPNETVTVSLCVQNTGGDNTANLVGTLLATGGVTSPSGPQNYGVVTAGGAAVCRNFTFTANGTCGGTITATLQLQDGATNLGTITYTFSIGIPNTSFSQNFDAVVAPALPAGWTTDFTGSGTAFTTSTTNAFSAPNAAFGTETSTTGVTNLNSPVIAVTTATAQISFRNLFNMESGFDGEVLEIKIGAGAYQDIITAGGSFVSGGYTGTLDPTSPFPSRNAWTGLSGGTGASPTYITSVVNLPAAAAGQNIQLRWRAGSDGSVLASGSPGVRIDNISITDGANCCVASVTGPSVTINQAVAQTDPTAISPINFTVVFSETVTGFATGDVTLSGTAGATTATVTGSGTTYDVAVTGMTSNGTVIATIAAGVAVNGSSINNLASTSTDNSVTFNGIPPSVTINQAAAQADPTVTSPINFTVIFNETVTGFTTGDVVLGGTAGATTATVTGSGTTYNIAVSGMTGTGTVIPTVPAGVANNAGSVGNLASTSTDNSVTYNATPPTVTINQAAAQADPALSSPINFTVIFNEPVTGFATGDVVLSGTAGATTATVTGSGTTYNVAVSGMTGSGTVIATVPAAVAIDIDANDNLASTSTDNTVTFNSCVLVCPANITTGNTAGQCGAIVNYPAPTTTAGCGTVTSTPASGSFFPLGTTTVNVTTTAGATCTFTVTVNDVQPPTITCPANITVSNTVNQCGAIVTFTPVASDNCPIGTTTPRNLTQSASNTVTPGNSVACAAGLLHADNSYWRAYDLAPLALVGPLTINSVSFGIETANASGVGTTQPITVRLHTSAGAFPGAVRTLVGSQTFNVPDQTNSLFTGTLTTPVTVPANAILVLEIFTPDGQAAGHSFFLGTNSGAETGPSYLSATACGVNAPVTTASIGFPNAKWIINAAGTVPVPGSGTVSVPASGSFFPVGITTVTSTATDGAGNTASCSFTVRVNDTQAPVITCPANITVTTAVGSCTALVTYAVTATDNCPGVATALTAGLASGASFPIGVTTVTYRATDAAGNITSCSFTVTVLDGQLPVISAQPANRTVCTGTNAAFSVTSSNTVSYQWQQYIAGVWTNIAGQTGSTLTLNAVNVGMNDNSYRVNVIGLCSTVSSGFASLYVNPLPTVSLTASNPPVLLPTQSTSITANVNPAGGTFAWFKNGAALSPAVTIGTLSNLTVENAGTYRTVYTDLNGCVNTSADLVISAQPSDRLYIAPNPNFGQFWVRYYNQVNEQLTLTVFNSNGARVYQKAVTTTLAYSRIDVDLGIEAPGVYVVELRNSTGKLLGSKKMIVSHR